MMQRTLIGSALAILLAPSMVGAAPFSPFEARGFAMGGAGVASSEYAAATLYNPALLAVSSNSNRFSFIAPALGASVSGSEGAVDKMQKFNDNQSLQGFNNAATTYNGALSAYLNATSDPNAQNALNAAANALQTASDLLLTDLQSVNAKTFQVGAGGTFAIAVPKWDNKVAFSLSTEFFGRATTDVTSSDLNTIDTLVTKVVNATSEIIAANGNLNGPEASEVIAGGEVVLGGDNRKPTSRVHVLGAAVTDIGVSIARQITLGEQQFMLGITPKIQQVATVAFEADVDTNEIEFSENKKTATGFNIDVGVAKQFTEGRWQNLRVGAVVRNLIPRTYKTMIPTQEVKVSPQLRVGAAYQGSFYTLTSDLDVTANTVVGQGQEQSQIWAVGGELNGWNVAKFRLGYRNDLKSNYGAITAGLSLFGVQLSGAYAKDREASAVLQFSGTF
ncbi:MAG: conjugal transfer protein TraF [Aquabacterium sp.]